MPFLNFGGNKNKHCNLSDINFFMKKIWKIGTRIRIRIHFGTGSTFSKCGSKDPDPLLRRGGSYDPDPDPFFPNVDPRIRIRIHVKMRWIRNADLSCLNVPIMSMNGRWVEFFYFEYVQYLHKMSHQSTNILILLALHDKMKL